MDYKTRVEDVSGIFYRENPKERIFVNFSRYQFSTTKMVFDNIENKC